MRKKNKIEVLTLPDLRIYYEVTAMKTTWYW